ncbi:methyltransferase [Streptomonospora wellingtoniae]|uniref:Methyltransferase n=1 Tax=Streptomonospora wellingtoniae TaxID=3075544 RepID=A0ABU2KP00_9ACTN|nr:methyltransferase [Streptomonospora sp. DSM 45055]MDT0300941.1 methyltransferase [Streptomonospora sp. DSM 45055]
MSTQPSTSAEEAVRTLFDMAGTLRPAAIRAAATLRLADPIAAGTTAAADLADLVSADPDRLTRLLRYLAALGLFERTDGDHYTLTELGELLRSDGPLSIRAMLDADGVLGRADLGTMDLVHTMRTGRPSYEKVFGTDFWSDVQRNPAYAESLEAVLGSGVGWDAELIIDSYPWKSATHVTDVGGGTGSLLIELLRKHGHLNGRVVDLPNAVAAARRRLAAAGLDSRGEATEASFFDRIPTGSDVYLLSAILADWTDEEAQRILRTVAEAAAPDGRVLLSEVNLPEAGAATDDPASTAADLYISATVTTPARTTSELVRIAEGAGLQLSWRGPGTEVRSLLEFTVVS